MPHLLCPLKSRLLSLDRPGLSSKYQVMRVDLAEKAIALYFCEEIMVLWMIIVAVSPQDDKLRKSEILLVQIDVQAIQFGNELILALFVAGSQVEHDNAR